jgi:hypothetical protein
LEKLAKGISCASLPKPDTQTPKPTAEATGSKDAPRVSQCAPIPVTCTCRNRLDPCPVCSAERR